MGAVTHRLVSCKKRCSCINSGQKGEQILQAKWGNPVEIEEKTTVIRMHTYMCVNGGLADWRTILLF